jgi:hypothetical protein
MRDSLFLWNSIYPPPYLSPRIEDSHIICPWFRHLLLAAQLAHRPRLYQVNDDLDLCDT